MGKQINNVRLSISDLDKMIKRYEIKKKNMPNVAMKIVDRLADAMMENVYPDTEKIPVTIKGTTAISGIRNTEEKWTYHEYGTGIIGAQFPHTAEALSKAGWKYDINGHGEKGWWYPTTDKDPNPYKWTDESGQLRAWTKGLPAERAFYEALEKAKELFPEIGEEELIKEARS